MRLYIQGKTNLCKLNLPANIDGAILFSFKIDDNEQEYSMNVDAINNEWVLKSNGNVNIIGENRQTIEKIVLKEYMFIPLSATGISNFFGVFCLPSVADCQYYYDISEFTSISIGKSEQNTIVYWQNMMDDFHATIKYENSVWKIYTKESNYVYVNNQRTMTNTTLHAGDIIFMNGLRLIWMQKFLIIPMDNRLYRVNGLKTVSYNEFENKAKSALPSNINATLYDEKEYFSHTPRIRSVLEPESIEIEPPPETNLSEDETPFILSIGSSFTMLGMMSLNVINLYENLSTGEKDISEMIPQIVTIITMLLGSMLIPFITRIWQKNHLKKKELKRKEKYQKYLAGKAEQLEAKKKKQEQIMLNNYIDLSTCIATLANRNRNLWNHTIKDDDFLEVRLGIGDCPSRLEVTAPKDRFTLDDDDLYNQVVELGKKYDKLNNVPIAVNLKNQIVSSMIMYSPKANDFINSIMTQILTLHSPLDLKIVIFTEETTAYQWNYLKYTNHNWSDDHQNRFFSTNQEEAKILSQILNNEFTTRKEKKAYKAKETAETTKEEVEEYMLFEPYYLIITDSFKMIRDFKFIEDLIENQINYGFSLLIIDKNMKNIPNECKKFIVVDDNESAIFNEKVSEKDTIKFKMEYANGIDMNRIGKYVSNIPVQGKDAESQLPNMISFLEMYNVGKIEQLNIRNRWANSNPMGTLSAPVGVHTSGELFNLDLHEKYDGPHGLIAGSTGSGKSEFIITYILSMALNYDPREVQFVLIDYKGGGLAGAFENRESGVSIPHLAGTITNLDTAEMNRTLVSIESELKRRQKQFNTVKEKTGESTMDIYKYQRLYREGMVTEPISHLFIISDEFAELKAQQPEFMAQLVSTARIGRSLGVHLILATQKPSGVVNDQIWSNSKFKVCLKVQTRADSMEMLKRPEAASLKEAGRFYLQVGYDEYFDIGQSAWSGDKYIPTDRIIKKIDNSLAFVDNLGNTVKRSIEISKEKDSKANLGDQLSNIVHYLNEISQKDGLVAKKLWLPPLRKNILLEDLLKEYSNNEKKPEDTLLKVIVGEYDAPANQEQGLLSFDLLKDGNMLIYGLAGSGKENLLFTIVYYLSQKLSPEEVNFYIGDFGSETLKILKGFPQIGDIFVTEEEQKLQNLIKMLNKELERRKKAYSEFGGNYLEYCQYSEKKDPAIVTILNNYEMFLDAYPKIYDIFTSLFRDGSKYGMIFIVTTTQQNALRLRTAQNFANKVCLKMPNLGDYRDLLGAPKGLIPTDTFGRGIASVDSEYCYEFQTADICEREKRTQFIREVGKELTEKYGNKKARPIPVLPEIAYVEDVLFELKDLTCVPIGIEKNSLEVYVYNFLELKINLIAAKSIKNHIYFIYALIRQMLELKNVKIHIIDALSIYRAQYQNIDLYSTDFEKAFITIYNNVVNDAKQTEKHVYFILGISDFKKKVVKYNNSFEKLLQQVSKCNNNTFLFFDDSDNYKNIQVEDWFKNNINNSYGIWLGEEIDSQMSLSVMSLSLEDKQQIFPCIGYPIYKGKHMIVKYVVDGVDKKDE